MPEAFNADKAMLYGRFVRAAYSMFGNDQTKLRPLPSTDFPAGYKLTAWIKMSDFFIANSDVKFYGFIAHSTTAPNQAILAIRGTGDAREWWDDSNAIGMDTFIVQNCGNVGLGFLNIYRKAEVIPCAAPQSLRPQFGSFSNQVAMFLRGYATASPSIEVAGHSLGAALAAFYAAENALMHRISNPALYTFASPKIGDQTFVDTFNRLELTSWRIVNKQDVVPGVPWEFLYRHVDTERFFASDGKVQPSLPCRHALATYLSLIDPTFPPDPECQLLRGATSA